MLIEVKIVACAVPNPANLRNGWHIPVVSNIFINWANIGEKSPGGKIFHLKITNMSITSLFKHLKRAFSF
jgi:hypothetical protein